MSMDYFVILDSVCEWWKIRPRKYYVSVVLVAKIISLGVLGRFKNFFVFFFSNDWLKNKIIPMWFKLKKSGM